jgi:hypothetical protein
MSYCKIIIVVVLLGVTWIQTHNRIEERKERREAQIIEDNIKQLILNQDVGRFYLRRELENQARNYKR